MVLNQAVFKLQQSQWTSKSLIFRMNINDIHDLLIFSDVTSPVGTQTISDVTSPVGTQTIAETKLVGSAVLEELQKHTIFKIYLDLAEFRRPNVPSLRAKATKTYNIIEQLQKEWNSDNLIFNSMDWLKFCRLIFLSDRQTQARNVAKSLTIYDIFANQIKCQTLKLMVEVMTKKCGTCAIRLLMFDSISVFYVPGWYVYAKGTETQQETGMLNRGKICQIYLPVKRKMAIGRLKDYRSDEH